MKRKILVVAVAALAGLTMLAQEKKEAPKKTAAMSGILHPEMAVENGTWDQPMATIGVKPDQPWTTTSIAAGVDAKPSAAEHMGHIVTVNGTAAKVGGYSAIYVQGLTK